MVGIYFALCGMVTGFLLGYLGIFVKDNPYKFFALFAIIQAMIFGAYWIGNLDW